MYTCVSVSAIESLYLQRAGLLLIEGFELTVKLLATEMLFVITCEKNCTSTYFVFSFLTFFFTLIFFNNLLIYPADVMKAPKLCLKLVQYQLVVTKGWYE